VFGEGYGQEEDDHYEQPVAIYNAKTAYNILNAILSYVLIRTICGQEL
jgi:hypothetical protein